MFAHRPSNCFAACTKDEMPLFDREAVWRAHSLCSGSHCQLRRTFAKNASSAASELTHVTHISAATKLTSGGTPLAVDKSTLLFRADRFVAPG